MHYRASRALKPVSLLLLSGRDSFSVRSNDDYLTISCDNYCTYSQITRYAYFNDEYVTYVIVTCTYLSIYQFNDAQTLTHVSIYTSYLIISLRVRIRRNRSIIPSAIRLMLFYL